MTSMRLSRTAVITLGGLVLAFPRLAPSQNAPSPSQWVSLGISVGSISARAASRELKISNGTEGIEGAVGFTLSPRWAVELKGESVKVVDASQCVVTPAGANCPAVGSASFNSAGMEIRYTHSSVLRVLSPVAQLGSSMYWMALAGPDFKGSPHREVLGITGGVELPVALVSHGGIFAGIHGAAIPNLSGRPLSEWSVGLAIRLWP
jgi:hypothetical protein